MSSPPLVGVRRLDLLSHTNLTEVTRMVLVDVGSVVVLTTGHTTTTRMLSVLTDTTVTGRDVATAKKKKHVSLYITFRGIISVYDRGVCYRFGHRLLLIRPARHCRFILSNFCSCRFVDLLPHQLIK